MRGVCLPGGRSLVGVVLRGWGRALGVAVEARHVVEVVEPQQPGLAPRGYPGMAAHVGVEADLESGRRSEARAPPNCQHYRQTAAQPQ